MRRDRTLYLAWRGMFARCYGTHPKNESYKRKGIGVAKPWHKFERFKADMERGHVKGLTLDRIDNQSNYSKYNCRWATQKIQQNNKENNLLITYKDVTKSLGAWADHAGLKKSTLSQRYYVYNWSFDKCLTPSRGYTTLAKGIPTKTKRNKQIVALRLAGFTFADIGRKFDIRRAFAKQVFDRDLPKFRDEIVSNLDR